MTSSTAWKTDRPGSKTTKPRVRDDPPVKGIVLAGGEGTRMWPATQVVPKSLHTVGLQPLVYYPIVTLMLADIREILVITKPDTKEMFQRLLGGGQQWGVRFHYAAQPEPKGLAQAFVIAAEAGFLSEGEGAALILGDNLFDAVEFGRSLARYVDRPGGTIFAYHVGFERARQFGVVEFDQDTGRVISVTEKPEHPKSPYMIPGLYLFDHRCVDHARAAVPSARGEVEITSVMEPYIRAGQLRAIPLARSEYWLDTGTESDIARAWNHVIGKVEITGLRLGVPEEVAWRKGWISSEAVRRIADTYDPITDSGAARGKNPYCNYLRAIVEAGRDYRS